jgi:hypothetical protein
VFTLQIGRKVYYEKPTGNVILSTSEMSGSVYETTFEDDHEMLTDLKKYEKTAIGVIKLKFGEFANELYECTSFRVNVATEELEFDYTEQGGTIDNETNSVPERITMIEDKIKELEQRISELTQSTLT